MDNIFFLSCFLPLTLAVYLAVPGLKAKNTVLLAFSLLFYSFGSITALGLLIGVALANYLLGLALKSGRGRKAALTAGLVLDIGFLGFFKYWNFLLSGVLGLPPVEMSLAVPLGISFFTFKCISYLMDAYRDGKQATGSFWGLLLYICFFPQITMGPITRFSEFEPQLEKRDHSADAVAAGLRRFAAGLGKKIILAGTVATVADGVFALETVDIRLAWLGAISYCLQLYFDFSGYIDMVVGLGVCFGFTTRENFNYPYTASSVGGFWRRWHMSLSAWFKDYVYIPLGGNRKGKFRAGINKCIVFLLCGLWHGAAWTFVIWGMWHGLFSLLESMNVIPPKKLEQGKGRIIGHIYTLLIVCIGFVMFRATTVSQGLQIIGAMFTGLRFSAAGTVALKRLLNPQTLLAMGAGLVLSIPVSGKVAGRLGKPKELLCSLGALAVLVLCIIKMAAGDFAPSIYAQF
ncbi:MAG: MBOAT family protein [Oscillospiraceae bacterium]|nr:MBOAT family protein [Oscillospiraceae bacterium]